MRKFIERALGKLSKLHVDQIRSLLQDIAAENERLEAVLDSMTDGVMVTDVEHNLVLQNRPVSRLLPIAPGENYEHPLWEVIADPEIAEFVRHALTNQESVMDKEFALDIGATSRILNCSVLPLVRGGIIQGNFLLVQDVTERKGKEARLRRAESLASLTTLAAGVAHEIKNPLGSIGIHMQLIQKSLKQGESNEERLQEYIDVVNEEVERLNKIVVDFLFAVRPMDVELRDGDVNQVIRDLIGFVRYELEENGIQVEEDLEEELPAVELDEKYLKQALMNIVKNAMSAMPEGGTLRVSTINRREEVEIRVSDNGVGMSEDVLEKIFEPYFTTRDFGSGIGLTLVYKVVKEHRGEISVNSQEGRGTAFIISLPVPQREINLLSWEGE
jgi:two-component system, sporulation sensor kinase E